MKTEQEIKKFIEEHYFRGEDAEKIYALLENWGIGEYEIKFCHQGIVCICPAALTELVSANAFVDWYLSNNDYVEGIYTIHNHNLSNDDDLKLKEIANKASGVFQPDFLQVCDNLSFVKAEYDNETYYGIAASDRSVLENNNAPTISSSEMGAVLITGTPSFFEVIPRDRLELVKVGMEDLCPGTVVFIGDDPEDSKDECSYFVVGGDRRLYSFSTDDWYRIDTFDKENFNESIVYLLCEKD